MKHDFFRPTHDSITTELYDTFQDVAKHREYHSNEWIKRERIAVYRKACEIAKRDNLKEPTLNIIERYESNAYGHIDYGKKWAIGIVEWMRGYTNEN